MPYNSKRTYQVELIKEPNKMSTTKELILELKSEMSNRFDKIEERLTNVEADVKAIKNCPTIQKELNNQ